MKEALIDIVPNYLIVSLHEKVSLHLVLPVELVYWTGEKCSCHYEGMHLFIFRKTHGLACTDYFFKVLSQLQIQYWMIKKWKKNKSFNVHVMLHVWHEYVV